MSAPFTRGCGRRLVREPDRPGSGRHGPASWLSPSRAPCRTSYLPGTHRFHRPTMLLPVRLLARRPAAVRTAREVADLLLGGATEDVVQPERAVVDNAGTDRYLQAAVLAVVVRL